MAIGQSNNPNFNVQTPVANQSLVYDANQQAFVNANISSSGSITGASNVGSGQGNVFKQLSGTDLQFKTLVQGNNVTIADGTDSITITANGVVTTAENLGSGTGLFAQLNSSTGKVQFKGLVAGTGIALANNSTDVTVSINASTVDAATLGGNAASVFLTKADNLASVGSLSTARDNLSVYSKAEGDARYFKQGADLLPDADNTRSLGNNSNRFSDIYAVDIHGTVTTAGQVTSIANHDIGNLGDVDTSGVASNSILKWNGTKWAIAVDAGGITTLNALTDVDTTGAVNSSVLKYNATSGQWEVGTDVSGGGGGASTFVGLTDSPNNFVGAGSKFVKVNSSASALEFTTVDTDGIAEGTNLYFTNARADARIGAANISDLANVHTAAPTDGQVLKWDNGNSRWAPAADSTYTNFNTDFDNRLGTKNTDNLSEGSSNLYFTNARWDTRLGTKSTTNLTEGSNLYYTDARVNARVSALGSANWNTAFGWGDHSTAGYQTTAGLNASIDSHLNQSNPTSGYVLSWNGSDYAWVVNGSGSGDITAVVAGTGLTGGATSGSATLNVDVGTGANKIVQLDGSGKLPAVDGSNLTGVSTATTLAALTDVDLTGIANDKIIKYNSTSSKWEIADDSTGGGGSANFTGLTDTPANFSGAAGRFVKVNSSANALEFTAVDSDNISEGSSNLYYTDARSYSAFDTRLATKSTTQLTEGTNLYFTNARADARINLQTGANLNLGSKDTDALSEGSSNLYFTNARADARITAASLYNLSNVWSSSNPSDGQVLAWDNANSRWEPSNTGAGDITAVVAGTGLTGGATSGSATLNVDVGTGANKILQLDGSAKIPAVDGSLLTNIDYTVGVDEIKDTMIDFGTGTGQVSTADIPENTNLYYTDGRFDTRLATKSTTNLSEGTNLYFTNARADARITNAGVTGAKVTNWDTAYGWGNHASAGYLTSVPAQSFASLTGKPTTIGGYGITDLNTLVDSHLNQSNPSSGYVLSWNGSDYAWVAQSGGGLSDVVSDTTPQLGGDLDTLDKKVATSTGRLQLGGGFGAGGINDSGNTRTQNFGAYFNYTSDNSKRHYNSAWYNKQTLSANTSASNKKQGWLNNSTLDIAGYTHGVDDATNVNKYWGDYHWTNVTNSTGSNSTINGQIGLFVGSTISDSSTSQVNATSIIGIRSYAGAEYAGGTVTNLIGLYADTDKHGSATVTNRYSIYAPGANDKAYFAGQITTGAITLPNTDGTNGQVLQTNGSGVLSFATVSGGGSVAGSNTQVQFNDSGSFGADAGLTFNKSTDTLTAGAFASPKLSSTAALTLETGSNGAIDLDPNGSGVVVFKGNATRGAGQFKLNCENNSHGITIKGPPHSAGASYTLTLPNNDGNSGEVLRTDGSGVLSWVAQSGGGPADTDALSEGSSNLYFTNARADARVNAVLPNTGSLSEGSNLYFTDARADARITNALKDEDNMASNSATHVPSQQSVKAYVDAQVATKDNTDEMTEGSTNLYFTDARADARITAADIADLNNVNNASPTDGQVLTWDNSNSYWKPTTPASGGGTDVQRFKINYATNGQLSSITDKTSGISSVTIDSAAGGDITINFTGYSYPPGCITLYGYNYSANKYNVTPLNKDITLREIPGGGSTGSPTAFGSFSSIKIKAAEGDAGASRSFGTVTHTWVHVVMGG